MSPRTLLTAATFAALTAAPALADLSVRFVESAPKDRFVIANDSACAIDALTVEIDLTKTKGGLIFDTTGSGAGVEVFQPFEVASGKIALASGTVQDGDRSLVVTLGTLAPGQSAAFTIDVDDTLKVSDLGQIRVSGGEMAGAVVAASTEGGSPTKGTFDARNQAKVSLSDCVS